MEASVDRNQSVAAAAGVAQQPVLAPVPRTLKSKVTPPPAHAPASHAKEEQQKKDPPHAGADVSNHNQPDLPATRNGKPLCAKCQVPGCGRAYVHHNHLLRHMRVTHNPAGGAMPRIACPVPGCNITFKNKYYLRNHTQAKHTASPRRFACPDPNCSKTFSKNTSAQRHFKDIHSRRRSFVCEFCDKGFVRKEHLRDHMRNGDNGGPICRSARALAR